MSDADPFRDLTVDLDGTSQLDRVLAALDPEHFQVDERTLEDLIETARAVSRELLFFGPDNEPQGVWSELLPDGLSAAELAAFARNPERYREKDSPELFRPHRTLLLVFLRLLQQSTASVNSFTERHLHYYYRELLGLSPKPALPDRVHVLVAPGRNFDEVRLPAGTLLSAGDDALGRARTYATDRELVVNRATVERLASLHLERDVVGLAEVRETHRNEPDDLAMALFRVALGRPRPGDDLPPFPPGFSRMSSEQLIRLATLVSFAEERLFLRHFELREVVALERRRHDADDEWDRINGYLEGVAVSAGNPFEIEEPRDFEGNFRMALGGAFPSFGDIPEVEDIYDAYDLRSRPEVQEAIRTHLHFDEVDDFAQMMHLKTRIDHEWRAINDYLEEAGRRRTDNPAWQLADQSDPFVPEAFVQNFTAALGDVTYPPNRVTGDVTSLDQYFDAIEWIEWYFWMTAEEFLFVVDSSRGLADAGRADRILTAAHAELIYSGRRLELQQVHRRTNVHGMLRYVLDEDPSEEPDPGLLSRLERYVGSTADLALLEAAVAGSVTDWEPVYAAAEIAQRNRQDFPVPIPRREDWVALHPAPDATAVGSRTQGADPDRWPPFGRVAEPAPEGEEQADEMVLGFAVASDVLALSGGRRRIDLTLGFSEALAGTDPREAFSVEVSTEKGWLPVPSVAAPSLGTYGLYRDLAGIPADADDDVPAVRLTIELDPTIDPVVPLPVDQPGIGVSSPALRLVLRRDQETATGRTMLSYPAVRGLRVTRAHLAVEVTDLVPSALRNDIGDLEPSAPFEPFGPRPQVGSRLSIGHPELAMKRLASLAFSVSWQGVPENLFTDYYRHYPIAGSPTFTAQVALVDRGVRVPMLDDEPLFDSRTFTRIDVPDVPAAVGSHPYERLLVETGDPDEIAWSRHLAWELDSNDFQHGAYPALASRLAVRMAAAIANKTDQVDIEPADYEINQPYTPVVQGLTIAYHSSVEGRYDQAGDPSGDVTLVHLHPFGYAAVAGGVQPSGVELVPSYENEGELYIGLQAVNPPQTVSLLFQLSDGTGDPDLEPTSLRWSYADGDRWRPIDEQSILSDTTRNLTTSGIVELALPEAAATTLFTEPLYWLRVSVRRDAAGIADALSIGAQAVTAVFVDNGNDPAHYLEPLPVETITRPVQRIPGIGSVVQPSTSFGGRPAEDDRRFATRASERLRHKQRALSIWDYEHLVLERFPEVYKVKAVPAHGSGDQAPGTVMVIVIPDIRRKLPSDSFEPKAGPELLAEIGDFLRTRAPAWAKIEVTNAFFVAVRIRLTVRFTSRGNESFLKQQLIDDLDRYLSPWAYDEGADIVIGDKIFANSLIDFLERRPGVDFIANLALFSSEDGVNYRPAPRVEGTGYHVSTGRPDGVLRASRDHVIDVIFDSDYSQELNTGIDFMRIELDFQIAG